MEAIAHIHDKLLSIVKSHPKLGDFLPFDLVVLEHFDASTPPSMCKLSMSFTERLRVKIVPSQRFGSGIHIEMLID